MTNHTLVPEALFPLVTKKSILAYGGQEVAERLIRRSSGLVRAALQFALEPKERPTRSIAATRRPTPCGVKKAIRLCQSRGPQKQRLADFNVPPSQVSSSTMPRKPMYLDGLTPENSSFKKPSGQFSLSHTTQAMKRTGFVRLLGWCSTMLVVSVFLAFANLFVSEAAQAQVRPLTSFQRDVFIELGRMDAAALRCFEANAEYDFELTGIQVYGHAASQVTRQAATDTWSIAFQSSIAVWDAIIEVEGSRRAEHLACRTLRELISQRPALLEPKISWKD